MLHVPALAFSIMRYPVSIPHLLEYLSRSDPELFGAKAMYLSLGARSPRLRFLRVFFFSVMIMVYGFARKRYTDKHTLAIVVVANRTATIMWHVFKTEASYESRSDKLYRRKLSKMKEANK